ncbi:MAG: hypothetical protein M3198_02170 [Actinomycetota bacterium]|nr:hypothetical protein [Actinomycetota bacterium]
MLKYAGKPLVVAATLASVFAGSAIVQAHPKSSVPSLRVKTVQVQDAKTVDVTFNNPLASSTTELANRVFHAPHWDHDTPHSHEASNVALINEGRTARVTLDRALHSEDPPCDDDLEPRCSDDELDFVITNAADIYGQLISNDDWEVWAIGSER